jgi:Multicopper oxidase
MARDDKVRLTRRDMLRVSAGGAGVFALTASGLAVPNGLSKGSGALYIEAFPTSPLITKPFNDALSIPTALRPVDPTTWDSKGGVPDRNTSDSLPASPNNVYRNRYNRTPGTHQCWPGDRMTPNFTWLSSTPLVYQIKVQVAGHGFTSSPVQPINSFGKNVTPPGSRNANPRNLPQSTIYGFNGTFPGPRINAEYGRASLVRFENHLDVDNGYQRQDFGAPDSSFLTHLHNGHTAPESDGNPHYAYHRFGPFGRFTHEAAFEPGEWVDHMYLGYPAGGDDREKAVVLLVSRPRARPHRRERLQGHGRPHADLRPEARQRRRDRRPRAAAAWPPHRSRGRLLRRRLRRPAGLLRLPARRRRHAAQGCPQRQRRDAPGVVGKTYFRHFPNHGFVGDIFTVNGTAYPVMEVKRRKYRLRFLDASISRIYDFKIMHSSAGPKSAASLGYTGDELQGQYRLPDGQQCMKLVEIANEGGLLPKPIVRDNFELWPAKRREVVVDFTKYMDGTPTKPGDEIYLVDVMKMTTGRMWDPADPNYKVPVMKIVIGDDPPEPDMSVIPAKLRDVPASFPAPWRP